MAAVTVEGVNILFATIILSVFGWLAGCREKLYSGKNMDAC
jgi:hypothetical protein